jgi:exopolyphosphatase / guanosine-5'-triphosphate,3'-diphosphate pyrophosphatase
MPGTVAVIDIGSNSIKALVAARAADGTLASRHTQTVDARISAGISQAPPQLSEDGMSAGVEAVRTLVAGIAPFTPDKTIIVATSAVRDAANGEVFRTRVRETTGHEVRVLTGTEEASLIGRGLTCDPACAELRDFYVFDLGGGSLECLRFRDRQVEQSASLPLGCVRLMEKFVADSNKALTRTPKYRVMQYVHDELVRAPFQFSLPKDTVAVGTGGTVTTIRAILAARDGKSLEQTEPFLPLTQLRLLLSTIARMPLADRKQVAGLPPARADVFPVALATIVTLADVGAFSGYRHSLYNLRYGLADEALAR